ncbi:hypothetical protein C2G38_2216667 [Gigaspora rosea]|uniref:Uncharacterized protein n=1 Tax=Gigaspora rosea TaxID=44941 RepID=A0A397UCX3_9GLOM|nr:hypothetical protein C2G38_2216667 [Gigaspora rosea]CAG8535385.1 7146_t:CDS:2 [Gigaspora rosea]
MIEWTDSQIRISVEIEMKNIIILEGIESDFGIASQPELIENIIRALMDTNLMCDYMAGNRRARRRRTGAQYFDKFRTHFWKRPKDEFDRIRTINTTNHRRNRDLGNITPALSIEEVEHELGQTLPGNRRSRRNSVDSRRSRRRSASPSRDTINTNTNNPDAMNPETSTLQPPPYGATDEAQNISLRLAHANFPEMNQSHVVSSHKVANSGNNLTPNLLNMSLSQNESDVSMHDVGSQPLFHTESINSEENTSYHHTQN